MMQEEDGIATGQATIWPLDCQKGGTVRVCESQWILEATRAELDTFLMPVRIRSVEFEFEV